MSSPFPSLNNHGSLDFLVIFFISLGHNLAAQEKQTVKIVYDQLAPDGAENLRKEIL